ncbi:MAG: hypothetical protein QF577_00820 [Phycisphaerae bacterium]|jgi:hypothetical protein|nr:hypothetical protein [Phycisphaerae bacterium]MDP7636067.1 hypothetical protein [Phycisphaerae bacterium]
MNYVPKTSPTVSPGLVVLLTLAIASPANCRADVDAGLAIVIPTDSVEQMRFAVGELQKYLKEILGCEVPIDKTGDAVKGKCIRLCPEQSGPKATLGKEGYSIKTRGGQLVITGGLPRGISRLPLVHAEMPAHPETRPDRSSANRRDLHPAAGISAQQQSADIQQ